MTAQNKTTIKLYFETGDRPTQGQFVDLIDSYQDTSPSLVTLSSATVGVAGLEVLSATTRASAQTAIGASVVGQSLITSVSTAAAQQHLGGGVVGRQIFEAVTTAAAQNILAVASATTTTFGIIKVATTAQTNTGTISDAAIVPATLKGGIGFSSYFQSANQTITAGGALTIAHGLGRQPINYLPFLVCLTGEFGYTAGQEIATTWNSDGADANGMHANCVPDATNLNIRYGNSSTTFTAVNFGTGAQQSLTNANWAFIVRAWA